MAAPPITNPKAAPRTATLCIAGPDTAAAPTATPLTEHILAQKLLVPWQLLPEPLLKQFFDQPLFA